MQITLPTLHTEQRKIYQGRTRFNLVRCGRRWGKTAMAQTIAANSAANGRRVGWFVPQYKILYEAYVGLIDTLNPIITNSSKTDGIIDLRGNGRIDFWSLENDRAGRSRKYHDVIIDEAAFTKPNMMQIWETSIQPTLLDYVGNAWVLSTPKGVDDDNFFYALYNDKKKGFKDFHAPTRSNPYMSADELKRLEDQLPPLVWRQEYLAEFVDWSGAAFFSLDKMLVDGNAVPYPEKCDGVYAVIDTAVKGGREHDGTAITYFALNKFHGHPLIVLDYDIIQIDGALLETWMPTVFDRLEQLARATGSRNGNLGVWIEDAAAGSILIQQGKSRGWNTHAIDSKLTSVGKDERAISVSGYFHQEMVKLSHYAFDKTVIFKGISRNHLVTQLTSFRIGDKDAYKRSDDLLDSCVCGVAIGLGNKYGY
jgi:hypothetical protein